MAGCVRASVRVIELPYPPKEHYMRPRLTCVIAVCALVCLPPLSARSQSDTALKLSTTVPQAIAEFKAGLADLENMSGEAGGSHFEAAVKADPNFGLARVLYVYTAGLLGGALTPSQDEVELNRGVADAAAHGNVNELLLAAAYREQVVGTPEAASAIARAASQLMPGDRLIAVSAFGFPVSSSEQVVAVRDFIARNPGYALPYNLFAYSLWINRDHAGALEAAKRQAELNPNAPNPHDSYAEILQWSGKFPEAAAEYRRATMTPPRFPEAYAGLAEVEALQGHYDQARAYLNQAIANAWSPQQKLFYMRQIAGTYALQGNSEQALRKQLDAIANEARAQQNPQRVAISMAQTATVYANTGNAAAAHQAIAGAKAASTDVPWLVNYYATMSHALMKHWGPANQELTALKARATTDPTVSKTLIAAAEGNLATQQGRPADALKILMAADTTDIVVMNRIAEAHAALGHPAEAKAWYNKVNSNYALNLADFPAANARRRTRMASSTIRTP
jgi:tetratricopeptide (TPR) repeat protein